MRFTALIIVALALPFAVGLSATSCVHHYCTKIGYENGLVVQVRVPEGPAAYRVEVEAEGEVLSLRYEVAAGLDASCVGECTIEGRRIELRPSYIGITEDISTLVTRRGGDRGPRQATVRVYRDEVIVAEGAFEPRYQTSEPNGPGCGEHVFASASLEVP